MNPAGAVVADGNGTFTLCGRGSQQNCVIDGDTIRYGGIKIRLEDIDAPEVFSPRCASEAKLGRRAAERLLHLMNSGPFQLVSGERDEDRYGRKLRTIERGGRSRRRGAGRRRPGAALGGRQALLVRLTAARQNPRGRRAGQRPV